MGPYSPDMKKAADHLRGRADYILVRCEAGELVLLVPASLVPELQEVVRRGMHFEHGESEAMHQFADALREIVPPSTPPTGTNTTSG